MSTTIDNKKTKIACCTIFMSSALINNFVPLLFSTFQNEYGISFEHISVIISCNFVAQIAVSLIAPMIIDVLGYRLATVYAHITVCTGFVGLVFFPAFFPYPFVGLMAAVFLYAIGHGVLNTAVNPIINGCTQSSAGKMRSLFYSTYCWGTVIVVATSTLFFAVVGYAHWRVLSLMWVGLPLTGVIMFAFVPINAQAPKWQRTDRINLFREKTFIVMFVMMVCAGASEHAITQWASMFTEIGLNVSSITGNMAGPCLFAVMMGLARILYPCTKKIELTTFMFISVFVCIISYMLMAFSPIIILSFAGFGLCGFAVGIFWPGTISLAASQFSNGSTFMYAVLTLAGHFGSVTGPVIVGIGTEAFGLFRLALFLAAVFPITFGIGMFYFLTMRKNDNTDSDYKII